MFQKTIACYSMNLEFIKILSPSFIKILKNSLYNVIGGKRLIILPCRPFGKY